MIEPPRDTMPVIRSLVSGMNGSREAALVAYGRHLGTAFQLVDDALDYSASAEELGKNIGDDLAEGKPTLPLIYAMQKGTPAEARLIREAIENGGRDQIEAIMRAIESTGALEYTARSAEKEAAAAVGALAEIPDSDYKSALEGLARFAVARRH
jgi:octaprenyl-diphosphate synthase